MNKLIPNSLNKYKIKNVLVYLILIGLLQSCTSMPSQSDIKATGITLGNSDEWDRPEAPRDTGNERRSNQTAGTFLAIPNIDYEYQPQNAETPTTPNNEEPVFSITIEDLPVASFINQLFAETLELPIEVAPSVAAKTELVTIKVPTRQTKSALYDIGVSVLQRYGVQVTKNDALYTFENAKNDGSLLASNPILMSGKNLPQVPKENRPIFQLYPLSYVPIREVLSWVQNLYSGQEISMNPDVFRNVIQLYGKPDVVANVIKAIQLLDQPRFVGAKSFAYEPVYVDVNSLTDELNTLLRTQGIAVNTKPVSPDNSSIFIIPIQRLNQLFVFTSLPAHHELIRKWVNQLDQPQQQTTGEQFFFYTAENQSITQLGESLLPLISEYTSAGNGNQSGNYSQINAINNDENNRGSTFTLASNLVINTQNNSLIYKGEYDEWLKLFPLIKKLDTPIKSVMIEVVIAELTLSDTMESGVEWLLNDAGIGSLEGSLSTLGSLGIGGGGITYRLLKSGATRAVLNASATNSRISVLSSPSVLVKNGTQAEINVGDEVPVITSQNTTNQIGQGGDLGIVQEVQYRTTGVILSVLPTIHSGRLVDIEIEQEVSQAQTNNLSNVSSPVISNRTLKTSLTLQTGMTVVMGGMIQRNSNVGDSGIPVLKDLPLVGGLFNSRKKSGGRTELVLMVTPTIIDNADKSAIVTEAILERLSFDI